MNCNTTTDRSTLDHHLIASRAICHREQLRLLPGDIAAACGLIRAMIVERDMFDEDEWTPYNNNRNLDAIAGLVEAAAFRLSDEVFTVVGETDNDLPTLPVREPSPPVEVSPAEQRASWQKIADCAAAELAKLDAADQGEADTSNGGAE